jgi:hypothetical protein
VKAIDQQATVEPTVFFEVAKGDNNANEPLNNPIFTIRR